MSISIGLSILTENICGNCTKFISHLLTTDQKDMDIKISQELLNYANVDENFLKNFITIRLGFMAMTLKPRDSHLSGWEKDCPTKKPCMN